MDEPSGGTLRFSGHWILTNVFVTQCDILTYVPSIPIYTETSPVNITLPYLLTCPFSLKKEAYLTLLPPIRAGSKANKSSILKRDRKVNTTTSEDHLVPAIFGARTLYQCAITRSFKGSCF